MPSSETDESFSRESESDFFNEEEEWQFNLKLGILKTFKA